MVIHCQEIIEFMTQNVLKFLIIQNFTQKVELRIDSS